MSELPPCPSCGKPPKRSVRDGYSHVSCSGARTPTWHSWSHDIDVWAFTEAGAERRWRRLVERLLAASTPEPRSPGAKP